MDTTTLVSDLTENGQRIVEQLPQGGFEVTAAFWLKKAEDGQWYFYIVSPLAEIEKKGNAQSRLFTIIRQMPEPHWINPLEVRLIGPNHPLAKEVFAIRDRVPGPKERPIRWNGWIHGTVSFEGAYIYPLPAMASS